MTSERMDETGDAFSVRLLRAGRAERAPGGLEDRVLAAVGASVIGGGAGAGSVFGRTGLKWGVLLAVALGVTAAGWARLERPAPAVCSPQRAFAHGSVTVMEAKERPTDLDTDHGGVHARRIAGPAPAVTLATPRSVATHSVRAPLLSDELTYVRRAKLALNAHDPGAALSILDDHARAFPRAAFGEETDALRVEALAMAGDFAAVREAGDRFLLRHPGSPYAVRVRTALFMSAAGR